MTKLLTEIARICSPCHLVFGELLRIMISPYMLMKILMSKRLWCTLWACLEATYYFRHRRRCGTATSLPKTYMLPERNASP